MKSREELRNYYQNNPDAGEHILSYLVELLGGDKEDIFLMLDFYYNELEDTKESISKAINEKDYPLIFKGAHKLKGSLFNVGLFKELALVEKIEAHARAEENLEQIKVFYKRYLTLAAENEVHIQEAKKKIS